MNTRAQSLVTRLQHEHPQQAKIMLQSLQETCRTPLTHFRQHCSRGATLLTAALPTERTSHHHPGTAKDRASQLTTSTWNLSGYRVKGIGDTALPTFHPSAVAGLHPPTAAVHQVSWPVGRLDKGLAAPRDPSAPLPPA